MREFQEEFGVTVEILGAPFVIKNLYTHEGCPGHEVLFLYAIALPPGPYDRQARFVFHEDCGTACTAGWYDPKQLERDGGPGLFPRGLKARLLAAQRP